MDLVLRIREDWVAVMEMLGSLGRNDHSLLESVIEKERKDGHN